MESFTYGSFVAMVLVCFLMDHTRDSYDALMTPHWRYPAGLTFFYIFLTACGAVVALVLGYIHLCIPGSPTLDQVLAHPTARPALYLTLAALVLQGLGSLVLLLLRFLREHPWFYREFQED